MTRARAVWCLVLGIGGFILPAIASAASTTPTGFYTGLAGGLNLPETSEVQVQAPAGSTAFPEPVSFSAGFSVDGFFGYKWDAGFRTELEFNYRQADVERFDTASSSGNQQVISFMGNLTYDFDLPFSPYIGGGIGVGRDAWRHVQAGPNAPDFDDSSARLQWQVIGGLSVPIADALSLFADYRYIGLSNTSFPSRTISALVSGHDDRSHNVLVGFRYFLSGGNS